MRVVDNVSPYKKSSRFENAASTLKSTLFTTALEGVALAAGRNLWQHQPLLDGYTIPFTHIQGGAALAAGALLAAPVLHTINSFAMKPMPEDKKTHLPTTEADWKTYRRSGAISATIDAAKYTLLGTVFLGDQAAWLTIPAGLLSLPLKNALYAWGEARQMRTEQERTTMPIRYRTPKDSNWA